MPKMIHIGRADGSHYYYKEEFLLLAVCRCRIHRRLTEKSSPLRGGGLFSLFLSLPFSFFLGCLCETRSTQTETRNAHVPTSLKPTTNDPGHFRGICAQ